MFGFFVCYRRAATWGEWCWPAVHCLLFWRPHTASVGNGPTSQDSHDLYLLRGNACNSTVSPFKGMSLSVKCIDIVVSYLIKYIDLMWLRRFSNRIAGRRLTKTNRWQTGSTAFSQEPNMIGSSFRSHGVRFCDIQANTIHSGHCSVCSRILLCVNMVSRSTPYLLPHPPPSPAWNQGGLGIISIKQSYFLLPCTLVFKWSLTVWLGHCSWKFYDQTEIQTTSHLSAGCSSV